MQQSELDAIYCKRYLATKTRAKDRDIEFTISYKELLKVMKQKKCFYTGLPITSGETHSFDRIDSNKGYVAGNVVACHTQFNSLKGGIENPTNVVTIQHFIKAMAKLDSLYKG